MKSSKLFLLGIGISFLLSACYDEPGTVLPPDQSEEKLPLYTEDSKADTAVKQLNNYIDAAGLRQGYWKITGAMMKDVTFTADAIVREGIYVDSKEEGVWLEYAPNGILKRKVSYRRGVEVK